jgi:hypothetical protein
VKEEGKYHCGFGGGNLAIPHFAEGVTHLPVFFCFVNSIYL